MALVERVHHQYKMVSLRIILENIVVNTTLKKSNSAIKFLKL